MTVDDPLQGAAEDAAMRIMDRLGYVGVLAVEFFVHQGKLLANELAPRVHNTGHLTIEGAAISQFENHIRAICGLPLGDTSARGHAAMINLIGDLPDSREVLAVAGAHLHLYGKAPRPGRKLGHVTVTAPTAEALEARLALLRRSVR
jgi:5-(carboxyamino)imidazole ribonucleotide synthase